MKGKTPANNAETPFKKREKLKKERDRDLVTERVE